MLEQLQKEKVNTDEIFSKKYTANDAKIFRPSIAELVKKISNTNFSEKGLKENDDLEPEINDEEKKEIANGLSLLKSNEQQVALLIETDPRNSSDFYTEGYQRWARDNSQSAKNLASYRSKASYWLGSTLVANPAENGIPDYVWYLPQDRLTCFRGHFNPKTYHYNKKYILHTNRYILELRDKLQKRIAFLFLIAGLVFGGFSWTTAKVHMGYSSIASMVQQKSDAKKSKEQQLEILKLEAENLVIKYKSNGITDAEFQEKVANLKLREKSIQELNK